MPFMGRRERDTEGEHRAAQIWLLTFTDLVSLMLTFFVMLFAMSSVKLDKWKNIIDSLSRSLSTEEVKKPAAETSLHNIAMAFRKRAINLDYLTFVLREKIEGDELLKQTQFLRLEDRLVLALPGDVLFDAGRAVLSDRAREALYRLGSALNTIGNQIGVNGHSDPAPPAGKDYASNWELSAARAAAVANELKRAGYAEPIVAFGYGDGQYDRLPDMPPAQRALLARRVDIVVFPTVGGLQ